MHIYYTYIEHMCICICFVKFVKFLTGPSVRGNGDLEDPRNGEVGWFG